MSDNSVLTWKSSNNKIATVSSKGKVTGIKKGTVTITATIPTNGYSATTTVNVGASVNVKNVSVSPKNITVGVGESKTIITTVSPANSTNSGVKYKSSNKKIAKVTSNGQVIGVKKGSATITVSSNYDSTKKATVKVKVTKLTGEAGVIQDFTMDETLEIEQGQKKKLNITGVNARIINFSINNKKVTVDSDGTVNAISTGTAIITAKAGDYQKTCTVKVLQKVNVESVNVTAPTNTIGKGQNITLIATVLPETATNKGITWKSSNEKIATVKSGVVTGVKKGSAVITAVSKSDTTKKGTFAINIVNEKVKLEEEVNEEVNDGKWENNPNDTSEFTTTLQVGNTTYAPWHEDGTYSKQADNFEIVALNKEIADIDDDDLITGYSVGTAVIELRRKENVTTSEETTESSNDEEITESTDTFESTNDTTENTVTTSSTDVVERLTITVVEKKKETQTSSIARPSSISISIKSKTIKVKKSRTAKATVNPSNASQKVKWSSSNKNIATVNSNGKITAKKKGKVKITATSKEDSKVKKSIKITVKKASSSSSSSSSGSSSSSSGGSNGGGSSSSDNGGSSSSTNNTATSTSPKCLQGKSESQYSEYCIVVTGYNYTCPPGYKLRGKNSASLQCYHSVVVKAQLSPIRTKDAPNYVSGFGYPYCINGFIYKQIYCFNSWTKPVEKKQTTRKSKKICGNGKKIIT